MKLLITGGAGFIGSHVLSFYCKTYPSYEIYCIDSLSYASDYTHIKAIELYDNFKFIGGSINDSNLVFKVFKEYDFHGVIHLAAESHVDNSIEDPLLFAKTNVMGTLNLLEACRIHWQGLSNRLFYHISTDEVFGSLLEEGSFSERTSYDPRSPYSASKASSDHFVRAYYHTYNLPVIISNCSNNYGPYQHDEKLIPTVIRSIIQKKPIPVYGTGENIRDWLYVEDHVNAIDLIFHEGIVGKTYCIGGDKEVSNLTLIKNLVRLTDSHLGNPQGFSDHLITFVEDRKGHDFRYAIDHSFLTESLGWRPSMDFDEGLSKTIKFYIQKYTEES